MTGRSAAQLRADFDQAFARPVHEAAPSREDFLTLKVDDALHAVRLAEVARLLPLAALAPLPGPLPALLGVMGLRGVQGALVPVYDLRLLLGRPAKRTPRWVLVAAGEPAVAFAFDSFEGHLRLSATAQLREAEAEAAAGADGRPRHVRELLQVGAHVSPVVSLASLRESIKALVQGRQQDQRQDQQRGTP